MHPQRCNPLSFIMNLPMNYLLETLILARGMERIKFHLAGLFRQSRMKSPVSKEKGRAIADPAFLFPNYLVLFHLKIPPVFHRQQNAPMFNSSLFETTSPHGAPVLRRPYIVGKGPRSESMYTFTCQLLVIAVKSTASI